MAEVKLHFLEQWWCVSAFTSLQDKDALAKRVDEMRQYAIDRIHSFSENEIDKAFVPEEADRKAIAAIAPSLMIDTQYETYIEEFNYPGKNHVFPNLGYIIFRVRVDKDSVNQSNIPIRPNFLQQIIFRVWFGMIKKFEDDFLFDDGTPPYAISVCSGYLPAEPLIKWNPKTANECKSELGQWIEIYSGQFEDYRDELHESRIEVDLSNRTSEMHFINRNSGLIYMEPDNYRRYFIKDVDTPESSGYMMNTVLKTIIRIRTILFAMILVNKEIDEDTRQLTTKEFTTKDPSIIKSDLEKTSRMKMVLQRVLAPFFTDLTRSHRQHYHAVLNRCVEMNEIEKNWKLIREKIEANMAELNSIFMDKQEAASKRQEKILSIVNFILGAGILFDFYDAIMTKEDPIKRIFGGALGGISLITIIIILLRLKKSSKS